MKLENIKDLQKVIQLCRKSGVDSIRIDNVEFHLGPKPMRYSNKALKLEESTTYAPGGITADTQVPVPPMPDELTEEQLLMWSVQEQEGLTKN